MSAICVSYEELHGPLRESAGCGQPVELLNTVVTREYKGGAARTALAAH